ncbi:hypothetical protein RIF29_18615 [Crotalaria pallida]|uniref:Uncharacterized protein n=1 Tax=Crotalaria pallida TaxID=3830 RepID=A0AAN9F155_CROPI
MSTSKERKEYAEQGGKADGERVRYKYNIDSFLKLHFVIAVWTGILIIGYDNDDDEWYTRNIADASRGRVNESSNRHGHHAEAKFKRNVAVEDSESEGMLSDIDNAMLDSDKEEKNRSNNYRSSSSDDDDDGDEYAYQIKRDKRNGGKFDGSAKYHESFGSPKSERERERQEGIRGTGSDSSESEDLFSNSEKWMLHSDAEYAESRESRAETSKYS